MNYNSTMTKSKITNKRPSMKDVAELASVSRTTVSFVINDVPNSNIPEETQDRVRSAVKELGYRPNAIAKGLRSQTTETIGFISDLIATTPHAGRIIQGAQEMAWENEKLILLVNTDGNQKMKNAAVNMMLDRRVDGIIYATMFHRKVTPPESLLQVPAVLLDCFVENKSITSIVPDEIRGGREATTHLIKNGHRRIAFLNNIDQIPATIGRLEGYRKALADHQIPYREELVTASISDPSGGYDSTMKMMKISDPPTALFCFNDRMAMGAYDAIKKLGLSIPNDVAVIGFDNEELIAAHLHPALTTMALPHYEMGRWAISYLLQQIEKQEAQPANPVQQIMKCPLIERDSV
jgi:LacI family transcriptional regulator